MLAVTHIAVSLLLVHALTLDRNDTFVALTFGVFIDFDHLFGLKEYVDAHGVASAFDLDSLMSADGQWKSMLHNPVAAVVVGPVATASKLALPLVFWAMHVAMDYAEETLLGLFSAAEMILLTGTACALLVMGYSKVRLSEPGIGLSGFLWRQLSLAAYPFLRVMRAVNARRCQ